MIKLISKSEEIIERLRKEGKVKTLEWTPEQQMKWMEEMEELRRESRYKQAMSEIEASKIILNA
jgi:hypothetical protein